MNDASEGLLATAERHRIVFDVAPLGLLVIGKDYRVLDCNDALAEILHSKRERIIGLDMRRIPDQRILPAVEQALAGEDAVYQGPYQSATSGAHIIALLRARPVRDASGEVSGAMAVVEDATERVRVEEDLRQQLQLVQEQAATIHALSTPILKVWDRILCLPIIGMLDQARISEMTETMLHAIISERARFAIIDLTGVEVVDTATAQHLMQLFRSARLVGAEGLLCGLRPAVAQTLVALGGDMGSVRTKRTLEQALQHCLAVLAKD